MSLFTNLIRLRGSLTNWECLSRRKKAYEDSYRVVVHSAIGDAFARGHQTLASHSVQEQPLSTRPSIYDRQLPPTVRIYISVTTGLLTLTIRTFVLRLKLYKFRRPLTPKLKNTLTTSNQSARKSPTLAI